MEERVLSLTNPTCADLHIFFLIWVLKSNLQTLWLWVNLSGHVSVR